MSAIYNTIYFVRLFPSFTVLMNSIDVKYDDVPLRLYTKKSKYRVWVYCFDVIYK